MNSGKFSRPKRGVSANNSKSLVAKLNTLETKYTEFINNCSNYIQAPKSPKPQKKLPQSEKISSKRTQSSDLSKENQKLKRQIDILSSTIEELNQKVSTQEKMSNEYSVSKELDKILKTKNILLEKQEQDLIHLKKELERSKFESQSAKTQQTEKEKISKTGSSQVTKNLKNNKSPLSQRWAPKVREYSPIDRKASVSPINRNISPRDRVHHNLKQKVKNLEENLEKVKEERDLYKVWQKVVSDNPPLPPAIESIINRYESELSALSAHNRLLKSSLDKLSKQVKEYISEASKLYVDKDNEKHVEVLESKKRKILDTIVGSLELNKMEVVKTESKLRDGESPHRNEENVSRLKLSQTRLIREYEDLEKIMKREQNRADLAFFELNIKTAEISELKRGLETVKNISSSAHVTTEHFFDSKNFTSPGTFSFGPEENRKKFLETEENDEWKDQITGTEFRISGEFKKVLIKLDEFQDFFDRKMTGFRGILHKVKGEAVEVREKLRKSERIRGELEMNVKVFEEFKGKYEESSRVCLEYEGKVVEKVKEIEGLKKNVKGLEEGKKELESQVKDLRGLVEMHEEKVRVLEVKEKMMDLNENLIKSDRVLSFNLSEFIKSVNLLFQKNFNTEKLTELQSFLLDRHQYSIHLESKLLEKDELISEYSKSLHKLTQELHQKQQAIDETQKTLQTLYEKITEKEKILEINSKDLQTLTQELEKKDQIQSQALKSLQDLTRSLDSKEESIKALTNSIQDLTQVLDSKEESIKTLTNSIQDLTQVLETKEDDLKSASKSIQDLTQKILDQETQLKSFSDSQSELTQKLSETLKALTQKSQKLESTEEEFASLQTFYDSIYNEKLTIIEDLHNIQQTSQLLQSRLAEEQISLESIQCEKDLLKKSCEEKEKKISEQENNILLLRKTIDCLNEENNSRIISEENARNEKSNEIDILKSCIQNLEKNISQQEKDFQSALNEKESELQEALKPKKQNIDEKQLSAIEDLKLIIRTYEQTTLKLEKEVENCQSIIKALKNPQLTLCFEYSETLNYNYKPTRTILLSPHSLMRTESLEEMPEIVLDEEKTGSRTNSHDLNLQETTQLTLLSQLQDTFTDCPSEIIINWCKNILGSENYIMRYPSSGSIYSEESKSNFDEISVVSESNQELNYRAHAKLMQQKKLIESLIQKLKDKKEKLKLCQINIKTLQNEIRNLDNKIKTSGSIDIEYLKTSICSFSKNLKNIDNDSLKILQVIHSQLGIKMESIGQKKWSFFNKK